MQKSTNKILGTIFIPYNCGYFVCAKLFQNEDYSHRDSILWSCSGRDVFEKIFKDYTYEVDNKCALILIKKSSLIAFDYKDGMTRCWHKTIDFTKEEVWENVLKIVDDLKTKNKKNHHYLGLEGVRNSFNNYGRDEK